MQDLLVLIVVLSFPPTTFIVTASSTRFLRVRPISGAVIFSHTRFAYRASTSDHISLPAMRLGRSSQPDLLRFSFVPGFAIGFVVPTEIRSADRTTATPVRIRAMPMMRWFNLTGLNQFFESLPPFNLPLTVHRDANFTAAPTVVSGRSMLQGTLDASFTTVGSENRRRNSDLTSSDPNKHPVLNQHRTLFQLTLGLSPNILRAGKPGFRTDLLNALSRNTEALDQVLWRNAGFQELNKLLLLP